MAFGWSAGDIAAAIDFCLKIADALREAGGAKDDYRDAIEMLKTVDQALNFLCQCQSNNGPGVDPSVAASIRRNAESFKQHVDRFLENTKKFEKGLGKGNIGHALVKPHWWQAPGRKIHWAFFVSKEVGQMTKNLLPKLQALQLLHQQMMQSAVATVQNSVDELRNHVVPLHHEVIRLGNSSGDSGALPTAIEDIKSTLRGLEDNLHAPQANISSEAIFSNVSLQLEQVYSAVSNIPTNTILAADMEDALSAVRTNVDNLQKVPEMAMNLDDLAKRFDHIIWLMRDHFQNLTLAVEKLNHRVCALQVSTAQVALPMPIPSDSDLDTWDLSILLDDPDYAPVAKPSGRGDWRLPREFNWRASAGNLSRFMECKARDVLPLNLKNWIGMGGFGDIRIAECHGRQLAVKTIRYRPWATKEDEGPKQYIRELLLLAKIRHRHIVQAVGGYHQAEGLSIILYPYARNGDLQQFLHATKKGKMWTRTLTSSIGCLADAVAYLHSSSVGICHQDIKPGNILVHGINMMLTDFGMSRHLGPSGRPTLDDCLAMTMGYAPPEVTSGMFGSTPTGFERDIFSLGITIWEMMDALANKANHNLGGPVLGSELSSDDLDFKDIVGQIVENPFPFERYNQFQTDMVISDNQWWDDPSVPAVNSTLLEQFYDLGSDGCVSTFLRLMTAREIQHRPSAMLVLSFFKNPGWFGHFCGDCCRGSEDSNERSSQLLDDVRNAHTPLVRKDFGWSEQWNTEKAE